ncbi:peptidyl-tRNA hydrolase, mitochondrial isoform X2, partial [Tanacetum coccineum]
LYDFELRNDWKWLLEMKVAMYNFPTVKNGADVAGGNDFPLECAQAQSARACSPANQGKSQRSRGECFGERWSKSQSAWRVGALFTIFIIFAARKFTQPIKQPLQSRRTLDKTLKAGFNMIDTFAETEGIAMDTVFCIVDGVPVLLAKSQTYMNLSGESFHDDMDLPSGVLWIQPKGVHGSHNGMKSVIYHFRGNREFARLRIGIGKPPGQMDPKAFLLQKFNAIAQERPTRLCSLLPDHLPRLMKHLVMCLNGSYELVSLGLRTLGPAPYPWGGKALQLLRKLGSRNRRLFKRAPMPLSLDLPERATDDVLISRHLSTVLVSSVDWSWRKSKASDVNGLVPPRFSLLNNNS